MRKLMMLAVAAMTLLATAMPVWAVGRNFENFFPVTYVDREGNEFPGEGYDAGTGLVHTVDPPPPVGWPATSGLGWDESWQENTAGTGLGGLLTDGACHRADSTGILDITGVDGLRREVTLKANGPAPGPKFKGHKVGGRGNVEWGPPFAGCRTENNIRDGYVAGALWYSIDIERGRGDANTSTTTPIWLLWAERGTGAKVHVLRGGLGTVSYGYHDDTLGVSAKTDVWSFHYSPEFQLAPGWNRVVVINNTGFWSAVNPAEPETYLVRVYLNGELVYTRANDGVEVQGGNLWSNNGVGAYRLYLVRLPGGGSGQHFVGRMRFDNIMVSEDLPLPMLASHGSPAIATDLYPGVDAIGQDWWYDGNYPTKGTTDPVWAPLMSPDLAPQPTSLCGLPQQDIDADDDVDLGDFARFQSCFNGPNRPFNGSEADCSCLDVDNDLDVDLGDFGVFQTCFNGPNRPASSGCNAANNYEEGTFPLPS